MTREEIGSYLNLKLETVSCAFALLEEGLIAVQQKHVRILDIVKLKQVMSHHRREDKARRVRVAGLENARIPAGRESSDRDGDVRKGQHCGDEGCRCALVRPRFRHHAEQDVGEQTEGTWPVSQGCTRDTAC